MAVKYQITEEWLEQKYIHEALLVEDIAEQAGCTVANIRRLLKKWKIRRGKIAINMKLKPSWNTGLTKETDERLASVSRKNSGKNNPMYGKATWNKGLTKNDDERLMSVSKAMSGREVSEETRKKQAAAKIGKILEQSNAWNGGFVYSNGYGALRLTKSGKRMYRHRYEAMQALGRELDTDEHVHHADRNRHNNEWSNLLVLSSDHHNKLHRAIESGVDTVEQQIQWLKDHQIKFEYLKDYENCFHKAS